MTHIIIDGPIDTPWVRKIFPDWAKKAEKDGLLLPANVADNYFHIHK